MKTRAFPLAVACLLAITSRAAGQDVDAEVARESLTGLDGFTVVVGEPEGEEQEAGLTEDFLQTYLELRLRQARIPILSVAESVLRERSSSLYLNVTASKTRTPAGWWVYVLHLQVLQRACIKGGVEGQGLLARGGGCGNFPTWEQLGLFGTDLGQPLPDSVRGNLAELMDRLVNDYLAVNP